jgi:hypothetical protein
MMLIWLHANSKLEHIHSKYEIEIRYIVHAWAQKFDALFNFDVDFASDPVIVPHLHRHRQLRCVPLHPILMC